MTPPAGAAPGSWEVVERSGAVADLHERPMAGGRTVELLRWPRPALVLGSAQPVTDVDAGAAGHRGVDVVRRRSGGGAVLLVPRRDVWVDVSVGRDDPLWDDDVGRAFHWLGVAWAAALRGLGLDAVPHLGPPVVTRWSRRICFAGLGSGEVTVDRRKVVGISQRRTRDGARFQCFVPGGLDPAELVELLALPDDGARAEAVTELAAAAAGVDRSPAALEQALLSSLPA